MARHRLRSAASEPPPRDAGPALLLRRARVRLLPRRPGVGRLRHWGHLAALVLLVVGAMVYRYLTDPGRIRGQAQRFLAQFVDADVHIHAAEFSFFRGVHLIGVEVRKRASSSPDRAKRASARDAAFTFYCRDLFLKHDPLRALIGQLAVDEVLATSPACWFTRDAETGRFNIGDLLRPQPRRADRRASHLPVVRLRNASLQLLSHSSARTRAVERIAVDLLAVPDSERESTYRVFWSGGGKHRSRGQTRVSLATFSIVDEGGGLPWMSLEAAMLAVDAAVPGAARYCELLGLQGEIRAEDYEISAAGDGSPVRQATVRLRQTDLSIPVDEQEADLPGDQRYLRFRNANGVVVFYPDGAKAEFTARFHDSDCTVSATLHGQPEQGAGLTALGFDVELACSDLRLPSKDAQTSPVEARFVARLRKLRHFYRDFDPHGLVSLSFRVSKSPGEDEPIRLRTGRLEGRGCDAAYRSFPYRVENIRGPVDFTPEGVFLRDLTAEHAGAPITVNGWLEGPHWHSAVKLDIAGTSIPLDADLRDALNDRYRSLWDPFALAGGADIRVQLERAAGKPGRKEPWNTHVEAQLRDARACFSGFPYPIERLSGRVEVTPQGLRVTHLSGAAGAGIVVTDGQADLTNGKLARLELTLDASDLAFDELLRSALPSDAAALVQSFSPRGTFDLAGRLSYPDGADGVGYDFEASLDDVTVTYRDILVPIDRVSGSIRLRPDRIDILSLEGRRGACAVRVAGTHETRPAGETHLTVSCRNLLVDDDLKSRLPAGVAAALRDFEISGPVNTTTYIDRTPDANTNGLHHRTEIQFAGAGVRYAPFPLPFRNAQGTVVVDGDRITFDRVAAEHGDGRFRLDGEVVRGDDQLQADLRVQGEYVVFDEDLRQAVPWRWRRTWNNVEPSGTFDVSLTRLSFERTGDEPAGWTFEGTAALHDLALRLGAQLTGLNGTLSGVGSVRGPNREFAFKGPLDLDEVFINGRRLNDVHGVITRAGQTGLTTVRPLQGQLYGGTITGDVELTGPHSGPYLYAASATLSRVNLRDFLNAGRKEDLPPIEVSGLLDGRVYFSGTPGDPNSRRGGGRIRIYEANLFRMPLLIDIVNVLNLATPESPAAQRASAEFFVTGRHVQIRDIVLQGPALTMLGSGTMTVANKSLDIVLVAATPREWGRLPVLTELLEGTGRELVEIKVTGTLTDPSIHARPLRGLSGAIETLVQPKK